MAKRHNQYIPSPSSLDAGSGNADFAGNTNSASSPTAVVATFAAFAVGCTTPITITFKPFATLTTAVFTTDVVPTAFGPLADPRALGRLTNTGIACFIIGAAIPARCAANRIRAAFPIRAIRGTFVGQTVAVVVDAVVKFDRCQV